MHIGLSASIEIEVDETLRQEGIRVTQSLGNAFTNQFDRLIGPDGAIDGTRLQENWFPQVNAHVFLSHSHADEATAQVLAGWLFQTFGISTFIDSCIWGYSNQLLRTIDNKFCLQKNGTYNYVTRNRSTSHVHMMLTSALSKMIDNTECLLFLNTPNSVIASQVSDQTYSPWIYFEVVQSGLIRRRTAAAHRQRFIKSFANKSMTEDSALAVKYNLNLDHLLEVTFEQFQSWEKAFQSSRNVHPLDVLYGILTKGNSHVGRR